jgi:PAS domain S-box-containing protein
LIQISPGCESVYGYATEEFMTDPQLYAKIYHPDDMHILDTFIAKLKKGLRAAGKYRILHKDGSIRWIESKITPVCDDDGQLIRIDGVSRDVTQAKTAKDKLILSERRYRQIVETAHEGIWIIDENLRTIFVNQKVCDMLGYKSNEINGKYIHDFNDGAEKKKILARMKNRKLRVSETHESAFIAKTGRQVFCIVVTNSLFNADDRHLGTLAVLSDITQRKIDEDVLLCAGAN